MQPTSTLEGLPPKQRDTNIVRQDVESTPEQQPAGVLGLGWLKGESKVFEDKVKECREQIAWLTSGNFDLFHDAPSASSASPALGKDSRRTRTSPGGVSIWSRKSPAKPWSSPS